METPADPTVDPVTSARAHSSPDRALQDLFSYPLMSALVERRTRRLARGTSLNANGVSHQSANEPFPLTPLEEAILITCITGVTGVTQHDGPLTKPNGTPELGTPFLNIVGRTASSADNAQAVHFFMINDEGIWLLRHPRGRDALEMLRDLPPRWSDWRPADWIAAAERCKVHLHPRRLDFPREWPYYLGWNAQMSNVPGSTVLFPVVDCTWQYINALLIVAAEPKGKRPIIVDDWRPFKPHGVVEWGAKLGGMVGLAEKIPYHPVGGLKWVREGWVSKTSVGPLGAIWALRTDYEAFFHFQNLMLLGQAMGLAGWIHGSVFPPYIFQRDAAKGWEGLGFRMQQPKKLNPMPPPPASQPNPVGIDGVLEGLCPPYVSSMDEAVEQVIEMKYGEAGGAYGDKALFARSYRNPDDAQAYLDSATRFAPDGVRYVKEICNYIYDTYGRFPAHVDAFYSPGMWVQFSHPELEYYDRYFDPAQHTRQREHDARWHQH